MTALTHGAAWTPFSWLAGAWHHCYGEYDSGTQKWSLYADNVLVAQTPTTDLGPFSVVGRSFVAGAVNTGAPGTNSNFFNGCMADARTVQRPVNVNSKGQDLAAGTLRPNQVSSKTMLGYWPLDVVGTSQADISGNGNTGTYPSTTPTLCGTSPPYVAANYVLMGQICA